MSRTGRPRKPTKLHVINGNPGGRALPENEPQPEGEAEKPSWLKGKAAEVWDQYAPELTRLGILTSMDADSFAQWCALAAMFRRIGPAKMQANKMARMDALASKFGLDPSSRSRMGVRPPPKGNQEEEFFGATG